MDIFEKIGYILYLKLVLL